MPERYVLALDQGTTSSRAIVFSEDGTIKALAQMPFPQIFPRDGWVEHDAETLWTTQLRVARQALAECGVPASQIVALGITNQRETTVLWERATGKPIANAIVWQDRRTANYCDTLRAQGLEPMVSARTGLLLDPYFSGTKLRWLLDNVPGARARAERGELAFGTVDSWLIWQLTGGREHVTDVTNASRTLLFNLRSLTWDDELLQLFNIPHGVLPRVVPSSGPIASTTADLLGVALPVAGMAGDQQAALYGQGCTSPGAAKNTYGTGCFALLNTGTEPVISRHRLLGTVAWQRGEQAPCYALEGGVFVAGALIQWLRDGLGVIKSADEIEPLARSVSDNGGVVLVPALTGLGAPHWDPYARGMLIGLTRATTVAHIARAALEAIAHQVTDVVQAMSSDAGVTLCELRVDGGASRNDLLMQMQADFLGVPVVRSPMHEATAFGAARLAGQGIGAWSDTMPAGPSGTHAQVFSPQADPATVQRDRARWQRALERSCGWSES